MPATHGLARAAAVSAGLPRAAYGLRHLLKRQGRTVAGGLGCRCTPESSRGVGVNSAPSADGVELSVGQQVAAAWLRKAASLTTWAVFVTVG
jgi:hypothetical protein